jgi:hypothetical protein
VPESDIYIAGPGAWKIKLARRGEGAEQLGYRLAKEAKVLPELSAILRCSLHGLQKSLENAFMNEARIKALVENFVTKFSGGPTSPGSFARAVRNSPKLESMWGTDKLAELVRLSELIYDEDHII